MGSRSGVSEENVARSLEAAGLSSSLSPGSVAVFPLGSEPEPSEEKGAWVTLETVGLSSARTPRLASVFPPEWRARAAAEVGGNAPPAPHPLAGAFEELGPAHEREGVARLVVTDRAVDAMAYYQEGAAQEHLSPSRYRGFIASSTPSAEARETVQTHLVKLVEFFAERKGSQVELVLALGRDARPLARAMEEVGGAVGRVSVVYRPSALGTTWLEQVTRRTGRGRFVASSDEGRRFGLLPRSPAERRQLACRTRERLDALAAAGERSLLLPDQTVPGQGHLVARSAPTSGMWQVVRVDTGGQASGQVEVVGFWGALEVAHRRGADIWAPQSIDVPAWDSFVGAPVSVEVPTREIWDLRLYDILEPLTREPRPLAHLRSGVTGQERWERLLSSVKAQGIRTPVEVGGGPLRRGPYLKDGHHRLGVAMALGMEHVPAVVDRELACLLGWWPACARRMEVARGR